MVSNCEKREEKVELPSKDIKDTVLFLIDTDRSKLNNIENCRFPDLDKDYADVISLLVKDTQAQALLDAIKQKLPSCEYIENVPNWKSVSKIEIETCDKNILNNLSTGMEIRKCGRNFEISDVRLSDYCDGCEEEVVKE